MMRCLPFLMLLGACDLTADQSPILSLTYAGDGQLGVQLERDPGHTFGDIHATANGVDLGTPTIIPGNTQVGQVNPGTAYFTIDMAQIATSEDIVVTEDGERFEVVSPTFGTPRTAQIITSLSAPLVAGETVAAMTNVAGDHLSGYFNLEQGQAVCVEGSPTTSTTQSVDMTVSADLTTLWGCGTVTPGSIVNASLELHLDVLPLVTKCDGNNLVCNVSSPAFETTTPVQVQL